MIDIFPIVRVALLRAKLLGGFIATIVWPNSGVGTMFRAPSEDNLNPGPPACIGRLGSTDMSRRMLSAGLFVAHNKMPCNVPLWICVPRTGRCSIAVVGDRGPRHADIDLYDDLARKLRHNGREEVTWTQLTVGQAVILGDMERKPGKAGDDKSRRQPDGKARTRDKKSKVQKINS